MYCWRCGTQIKDGVNYCAGCGGTVVRNTLNPQDPDYRRRVVKATKPRRKRGSAVLWVVLAALLVLAGGAIGIGTLLYTDSVAAEDWFSLARRWEYMLIELNPVGAENEQDYLAVSVNVYEYDRALGIGKRVASGELATMLDRAGAEGWEVCGMNSAMGYMLIILKRPR